MVRGTVKRKATPSARRQKKARQRIRKQIKVKRERKKPKWESAIATIYDKNAKPFPHKKSGGKQGKEGWGGGGSSSPSGSSKAHSRLLEGNRKRFREEENEEVSSHEDDNNNSSRHLKGGKKEKKGKELGFQKVKKSSATLSFLSPEEEEQQQQQEEEDREVESDVDEEKEARMNERNPIETQLFLKGLPLDTSEEELLTFLTTQFGKVKRVLLVKSKLTHKLSGTAFVHCGSKGLADAIFTHAQKNAREIASTNREEWKAKSEALSHHQAKRLAYKLHHQTANVQDPFLLFRGTKCTVYRPLKRTEAQETLSAGERKKKKRTKVAADDPRHLYLLQEGLILPDSPAGRDLPKPYLMVIMKGYEERKNQLRNNNYFVSTTRLSVRNLPRDMSENDFRRLFAEHARTYLKKHPEHLEKEKWGKYGPIKNVKVVRDTDGQAKGYGFIEFVNHQVALSCLRSLNNNPTVFGRGRRLIVAFAVENIEAIQKLKRMKELKLQRRNESLRG